MLLPTVAELCANVPSALFPANGLPAPNLEISAVHVSELADPTDYLAGRELLLTTGLSLPETATGCERYVSQLSSIGVSALGIGLGPSLTAIPTALALACAKYDLCLLVVPPAAAFLTVTKAYWTARSRSTQRELTDAISAHRSLVDAMVSKDPVREALKALSRAIGAWVARLDVAGSVEYVFPSGRISDAISVADQISTLRMAGMHSSATFPSGDTVVAVFPLTLEERILGYIAIGSTEPMTASARGLALTTGALLSLDSVQRQRAEAATQSQMQAVSVLLDMGFVEAAGRLTSRLGLPSLGDALRVLVVRSREAADVIGAVHAWMPTALPAPVDVDRSWFVIPEVHPSIVRLEGLLRAVDPRLTAVLSSAVSPSTIHDVRVGLFNHLPSLPEGTIAVPDEQLPVDSEWHAGIQRVLEYPRADLASTLVAYLRHRGQWDAAGRDIGVHRNTVRHRMTKVREILGTDIDDPDVTATLWLYLRKNGLA